MTTTYSAPNTPRLFLIALGPLILVLLISQVLWGNGETCYAFWREWGYRHPDVSGIVWRITDWGNPLAYGLYAVILLRAVRNENRDDLRLVLCYVGVQIIVTLLLTHLLKNLFGIPRPYTGERVPQPWTFQTIYQSFPSGHTAEIVGGVLPLAAWRRRFGDAALCGLWLMLVAYSRVYLGRHYLLDIWGGMAVGSLAALCILYFARKPS